jgi:hypothetical protein
VSEDFTQNLKRSDRKRYSSENEPSGNAIQVRAASVAIVFILVLLALFGFGLASTLLPFSGNPARVQAELDAFTSLVTSATEDTLLLNDVGNVSEIWPQCLVGASELHYGTNRSFEAVVANYHSLFVDDLGMRERAFQDSSRYLGEKASVVLSIVNVDFSVAPYRRARYGSVYGIRIVYIDPAYLWCIGD